MVVSPFNTVGVPLNFTLQVNCTEQIIYRTWIENVLPVIVLSVCMNPTQDPCLFEYSCDVAIMRMEESRSFKPTIAIISRILIIAAIICVERLRRIYSM